MKVVVYLLGVVVWLQGDVVLCVWWEMLWCVFVW